MAPSPRPCQDTWSGTFALLSTSVVAKKPAAPYYGLSIPMFTGIVQYVGVVRRTSPTQAGRRLFTDIGPLVEGMRLGDSVATNGACLTAAAIDGPVVGFDVIHETLALTNLGGLQSGSRVNLERALRLGDRLDGHMVQGHIDGQARVDSIDTSAGQWVMHFTGEKSLTDDMVPKGSIAIDGVSLTLVDARAGRFSVALIPTTLAETTLPGRKVGDWVNIETDILGKYVRRLLTGSTDGPASPGLTLEKLRQAGFA